MAFMHLGGDAGAKPTYFEVYAAEKLVPTLKAAVIYSLSVLGQTHSWILRLLSYEDEVYAVVSLLLEQHSLSTMQATFAESLYGLKRQSAATSANSRASCDSNQPPASGGTVTAHPAPLLSRKQQYQAVACQVLLPYVKSKCDQLYARHSQRSILGLAVARSGQQQQGAQHTGSPGSSSSSSRVSRLAAVLRRHGRAAFVQLYPLIHAAVEGVKFCYQLAYLLDVWDCHTPVLQLLGQRLVRLSGQDYAAMERQKQQRRQQQLQTAGQHRSSAAAALHRWWLQGSSAVSDNLSRVLILSVFGFKVLEWWYTSAEDRLSSSATLPPPLPPPPPKPDPHGVPLPADVTHCPLCRQRRVNPAIMAVSGYVFCYPCLFRHVSQEHCCPVTRTPATLDHIRKLYEAM